MLSKAEVVGVGHCCLLLVYGSCSSTIFFHRAFQELVRISTALRGRPAAVDREVGAGDLRGVLAAQEQRQRSHLLDRDEFLRRLGREQDVVDHLIPIYVARLHRVRDLLLHQRRPDVAGADAVAGDLRPGELQRHRLGESHDAVLGRDVGRLEGRATSECAEAVVMIRPQPRLFMPGTAARIA
jgi:hypothetical protein